MRLVICTLIGFVTSPRAWSADAAARPATRPSVAPLTSKSAGRVAPVVQANPWGTSRAAPADTPPARRPAQTPGPGAAGNARAKKIVVMDMGDRSADAATRAVSSTIPREKVWTPPKPDLDEVDYSEEQQINRRLETVRQRRRQGR